MKLVVDIHERDYLAIRDGFIPFSVLLDSVKNGVPLPEQHGKLVDKERLIKRINNAEENFKCDHEYTEDPFYDGVLSGVYNIRVMVQEAPTIIEGSGANDD